MSNDNFFPINLTFAPVVFIALNTVTYSAPYSGVDNMEHYYGIISNSKIVENSRGWEYEQTTLSSDEISPSSDLMEFNIIQNVALRIMENTKDLEQGIAKKIKESFWDIYEPF